MTRFLTPLLALFLLWTSPSKAAQFSTYIQGTVIKRTKALMVVQTKKGTYWIRTQRPVSYTRKFADLTTGFWVQTRHIIRFRPASFDANYRRKSSNEG